ncbi:hypothetical protein BV898_17085 [Hypsibius exemplaris]|uniref:Apple domain-containing protein n=1 Tax=Hypsibius exemplaris TaxID=2072580 RepID=A0A9X6RLP1_HYPEX|nr:hypothetical protein BV898_17085 [Hypsibius exemplaris]
MYDQLSSIVQRNRRNLVSHLGVGLSTDLGFQWERLLTFFILLVAVNEASAIEWNGNNWAHGCDFTGGDFSRAAHPREECGGRCAATQGCTHFTWTEVTTVGTCFMKQGPVSKAHAFPPPTNRWSVESFWRVCQMDRWRGGKPTRYWDCCKRAVRGRAKAAVSPVKMSGLTSDGIVGC